MTMFTDEWHGRAVDLLYEVSRIDVDAPVPSEWVERAKALIEEVTMRPVEA